MGTLETRPASSDARLAQLGPLDRRTVCAKRAVRVAQGAEKWGASKLGKPRRTGLNQRQASTGLLTGQLQIAFARIGSASSTANFMVAFWNADSPSARTD